MVFADKSYRLITLISIDNMSRVTQTKTRDRILAAASELFVEKGYAATSTREIAERTGIQQPGLYRHFASKAEILRALFRKVLERPERVAMALLARDEPAAERLYRFVYETLLSLASDSRALAALLTTPELQSDDFAEERAIDAAGDQLLADLISAGVAEGDLDSDSPELHAGIVSWLLNGAYRGLDQPSITKVADFALLALLKRRAALPALRRRALAIPLGLDGE
jgi:AcrR family transcriptional regulator